jgi:hypothetical protein
MDSSRIQGLLAALAQRGLSAGDDGKGRSCWLAYGYLLAAGDCDIIALHDCDISDIVHPCVIILSMHSDEIYLMRALTFGAKGYLLKGTADQDVVRAVREVAQGRCLLQPQDRPNACRRLHATTQTKRIARLV